MMVDGVYTKYIIVNQTTSVEFYKIISCERKRIRIQHRCEQEIKVTVIVSQTMAHGGYTLREPGRL